MRLGLPAIALALLATTTSAQGPSLQPDATREVRGTRGGRVDAFTMSSVILGATRRIDVVLPASWATSPRTRRYPVAIAFDGESNIAPTAAVAEELARNGQIPELILVGIENSGGANARVHDLTPPGLSVSGSSLSEGGDRFLDFVERELLPAIDRQFRGAGPRLLVGHSSGGILATHAAATRPALRAVISIDAPVTLGQNWLAGKLLARARAGGASVRYVSLEARFGWPETAWKELTSAAPASWTLRRDSLRLEGHETMVMLGTYLGLREVFRDYSRIIAQEKRAADVLAHYTVVSESFGAPLVPPRQLLGTTLDDLIDEGRGAEARAAYELLRQGYGAPPDSVQVLAEIEAAERRGTPEETVESLLATPFPTPADATRFLGDWVGAQWMTASEPKQNSMTLRIRVEGAKVVAEMLNANAPPEMRARKVDYLRVTPDGLTYGFLNGMRPRGVVMWVGTLRGDTLSGTQRWGGVSFSYPPGSGIDPGFRLVKVRK